MARSNSNRHRDSEDNDDLQGTVTIVRRSSSARNESASAARTKTGKDMTDNDLWGPGHPGFETWRADRVSRQGPRMSAIWKAFLVLLAVFVAAKVLGAP